MGRRVREGTFRVPDRGMGYLLWPGALPLLPGALPPEGEAGEDSLLSVVLPSSFLA